MADLIIAHVETNSLREEQEDLRVFRTYSSALRHARVENVMVWLPDLLKIDDANQGMRTGQVLNAVFAETVTKSV